MSQTNTVLNGLDAGLQLASPSPGNILLCGDGRIDVSETCDDGNLQVGMDVHLRVWSAGEDADGQPENQVFSIPGLYDNCVDTACADEDLDRDGVLTALTIVPRQPMGVSERGEVLMVRTRDGDGLSNEMDPCPDVEDETRLALKSGVSRRYRPRRHRPLR